MSAARAEPPPAADAGVDEVPELRFLATEPTDAEQTFALTSAKDLTLPFTGPKGAAFTLHFSQWTTEHGDVLAVEPAIVEQPSLEPKDRRLAFTMDREVWTLALKVAVPPSAGTYVGTIAIFHDGKLLKTKRIVLTTAQGALAVEPLSKEVYAKSEAYDLCCLCRYGFVRALASAPCKQCEPATFAVTLRNTSSGPLQGLYLRSRELTSPKGVNFEPTRHLKLSLSGAEANDLFASPKAPADRAIAPQQQIVLEGEPVDLPPGAYTLKLGFGAHNATIPDEQAVALQIYVRHGWLLPFTVLLLAITVSFLATKGVEVWRRRGAHLQKVGELRSGWLSEEPASMALVGARALLRQTQDRSERWLGALVGPDVTTARLERAEKLLKLLGRIREVRGRIAGSRWRVMEAYRASMKLDRIVAKLDPSALDDAAYARVETDLDELDKWFEAERHDALYADAFAPDIASLREQTREGSFPAHADYVRALRDQLGPADAKLEKIGSTLEEAYVRLKLLSERNRNDDRPGLDELAAAAKEQLDIRAFLRRADDYAWKQLKKACAPSDQAESQEGAEPCKRARADVPGMELKASGKSEIDPPHAFQLIRFDLGPRDRKLGDNYLFKHNIEYVWDVCFERRHNWRERWLCRKGVFAAPKLLGTRRTNEPRLAQYAPDPGRLHVQVAMHFNGETVPAGSITVDVKEASEYGWLTAFRFADVMALGIAAMFAIISGLGTYYFTAPAFGSITDYVTLFLWGAGIDQTKNFLQHLGGKET